MRRAERVVRVETEGNIERLRQTALLLQAENARLHHRLIELTRQLAAAQGATATQLELEIQVLHEELAARTRKLFGASSERRGPEASPERAESPAATPPPRRGHGPCAQPQLPIVETVHRLDEPDRICPSCGGALEEWTGQFEEAEEIDVVERSFRVVTHRRQKYRCRCGGCVDTALGPPKLLVGGRYSVNFAVEVAIAKYADHLPLARQVRQMARAGLRVNTQALWDQLWALRVHLLPSYEALGAYVRSAPVIGADETTWRLMAKRGTTTWWVWAVTRPDAVYYRLDPSRSAAAAGTLLGDFAGVVVADGYSAYRALRAERGASGAPRPFTLAACWAHARRKLVEAEPAYPQVRTVLDLIRDLYAIEARGRELSEDGARRPALAGWRQGESKPLTEQIKGWLQAEAALPRSALGRAIGYILDLWPGLTEFLANPAIPIDNNHTERALRGVAIGRRNHYGSRSERGTQVAALFYSLIESAKLSGLEPAAYLREATSRAIANPGTVTLPRDLLGSPPDTS
jgi:transposase